MDDQFVFYQSSVHPVEQLLLQHELGSLFTGKLFQGEIEPFTGLDIQEFGDQPLSLSAQQVGMLFMAPDESVVKVYKVRERMDGAPAGVSVQSDNPFVQPEQPVEVIAYRGEHGGALQVRNLYVRRLILEQDAPERFCTVAFGLMAVTAYKLEFDKITLFAAGCGPIEADDPDELVGFLVWPKLGFDAPLNAVDLQGADHLQHCRSVQDVMEIDPVWWAERGTGREMTFDLSPGSRSWRILLNYLYGALEG
jgi:hypothetical protein